MQNSINQTSKLPYIAHHIAQLFQENPEITPGLDGDFIAYFKSFFFVYEAPKKKRGEKLFLGFQRGKRKSQQFEVTGYSPLIVAEFISIYFNER